MTAPPIPIWNKQFQYTPSHQTNLAAKWDKLYPGWRQGKTKLVPSLFGILKEAK